MSAGEVVAAADVDHAVEWITATVPCNCRPGVSAERCGLCVGLDLLREARRFAAAEVPF